MKEKMLALAREKLEETKRQIQETDRPYEPHVPDWDEWEPPEYVGVFKKGDIVGYHCRDREIERWKQRLPKQRVRDHGSALTMLEASIHWKRIAGQRQVLIETLQNTYPKRKRGTIP